MGMSELVRKGIEQAQTDLRKESDELIWQEGILRHVPLVGSIYNWISPAQKLQIKGRTLSLNEGRLQTTDEIFKTPPNIENGVSEEIASGIDITNEDVDKETSDTKAEE